MAPLLKFVLSPEESGFSSPKGLLKDVKAMSLAPMFEWKVRDVAVGLARSGRIFIGVNVDFGGRTISPEQFLVANLALNFERDIRSCLLPERTNVQTFEQEVSLLLVPQNNRLAFSDHASAKEVCSNPEQCSHTKCRALTAANKSYAPYNECLSGVALICEGGEVYRGWYIESRNIIPPGVGPLQAALVDFVARGEGKRFKDIVEAVLVEMEDAVLSQADTVRTHLQTIAPRCVFSVIYCHRT